MAFHNHLAYDLTMPPYAEQQLAAGGTPSALRAAMDQLASAPPSASGKDGKELQHLMAEAGKPPPMAGGSGPTWLNSAILQQQGQHYADGSFLHLQTAGGSSGPQVAGVAGAGQWLSRQTILRRGGGEEEAVPVSSDASVVAAAIAVDPGGRDPAGGELREAVVGGVQEGTRERAWQNARYKAEILAHPLYEQLLSAHVACLRIATPVDQLPRIDAQLEQSQQVVSKYSMLGTGGGQMLGDDREIDQFMTHYVLLLCSFKEQLQQHVRIHAMEAVMACWELEQSLQSLTGVSPGEGTGATMSDDDDDDDGHAESDTNLFDGSLDGGDNMGFGPLIPTETERTLMERVRQELKHELKQGYKEKIVDIREEILRKRRAGKLPGDSTSMLKAWWQSHSKWPYPTEDDKARLVQETGLQLKQINNWFINQRKRNWHSNPSSSSSSIKSKRKR